ncbi:MAG: hypothetical protein V4691_01320 [Pseudomonadota bacterium]
MGGQTSATQSTTTQTTSVVPAKRHRKKFRRDLKRQNEAQQFSKNENTKRKSKPARRQDVKVETKPILTPNGWSKKPGEKTTGQNNQKTEAKSFLTGNVKKGSYASRSKNEKGYKADIAVGVSTVISAAGTFGAVALASVGAIAGGAALGLGALSLGGGAAVGGATYCGLDKECRDEAFVMAAGIPVPQHPEISYFASLAVRGVNKYYKKYNETDHGPWLPPKDKNEPALR